MERLSDKRQDTRKSRRKAAAAAKAARPSQGLRLHAVGVDVIPAHAVDRALVGALVTEDVCYQFAVEAWQARKPLWLRFGARGAWRGEGRELDAKRDRLRADAAELGFRVVPATKASTSRRRAAS